MQLILQFLTKLNLRKKLINMTPTFPTIHAILDKDLENYPQKNFEGSIEIIDNLDDAAKAIAYLSQCKQLGFDTETRPSFTKGRVNTVALLQLCDNERAFLFRIQKIGVSLELAELFANPKIAKVGVAIHDDLLALQKVRKFTPQKCIDLQTVAKKVGIENFGLKKLTPIMLGFRISKKQQLTNWEQAELTPAQQNYAATDAWVCLKIYERLIALKRITI